MSLTPSCFPLYTFPMSSPDWSSWLPRIADADAASLDALEQELFGRKSGRLTLAMKELGALPPDERRSQGEALNVTKRQLEDAIADRRQALRGAARGKLGDDRLDMTIELPPARRGHLHLIPEFIRTIEDVFSRMGFDVAEGDEVETERFNFDLLNIPADHPARDAQDTFWVEGGTRVLRTHTSPVQLHYMQNHDLPLRMICPGKVYRKDADATHSPMFHQFEGLMIDRHITLAHMKAVMEEAIRALIDVDVEFRFRSSYFPFVEPGLEIDMRWRANDETKEGAWLEVVGCGMVHPNVLRNAGIDPDVWRGFAFGFGIERLLMIKHGIRDLRAFYEGDVRFLEQF